jgi:hypothetical protein
MNQWNNFSYIKGHVNWLENTKDYTNLDYTSENFNDLEQVIQWRKLGHNPKTGDMYDMRHPQQPALTNKLIDYVTKQGLEHIGVSYYRMSPGDNLPYHSDVYKKYITLFDLVARRENIIRYIFFPESRKPGHIFEVDGTIIDWKAGDFVAWKYDTPHLAANLGEEYRYTIQVTGVIRENI